jgi:hypothetical protein
LIFRFPETKWHRVHPSELVNRTIGSTALQEKVSDHGEDVEAAKTDTPQLEPFTDLTTTPNRKCAIRISGKAFRQSSSSDFGNPLASMTS